MNTLSKRTTSKDHSVRDELKICFEDVESGLYAKLTPEQLAIEPTVNKLIASILPCFDVPVAPDRTGLWKDFSEARELCGVQNWDGYEAQPVHPDVLDRGEAFARELPDEVLSPEVKPHPNGNVGLTWYAHSSLVLSVCFTPEGSVMVGQLDGSEIQICRSQVDAGMPGIYRDHLRAYMRLLEEARTERGLTT